MTVGLALDGGSLDAPLALAADEGGLATLLREALATAAGVDASRVALTSVAANATLSNGTVLVGAALALNGTSAANANGNATNSSAGSLVWSVRRLQQQQPAGGAGVCSRMRAVNVTYRTRMVLRLAVDVAGLEWVSGVDPAAAAAQRLRYYLEQQTEALLGGFVEVWGNCTGAPAANVSQALAVLAAPVVVYFPSPSGSPLAAADHGATAAASASLSRGGVTAIVVIILFTSLACFCWAFAAWPCCARWRKRDDEEEQPAARERGDSAALAMAGSMCRRGGTTAAPAAAAAV